MKFEYQCCTWSISGCLMPFDEWINMKGSQRWELVFMSNTWDLNGKNTHIDCVLKRSIPI